jgi:hypothetical protein
MINFKEVTQKFSTPNYFISFDDAKKEIYMRDLKDIYNETSAYNRKKRGYNAFKMAITHAIKAGDMSRFSNWVNVADQYYKLDMRIYCAMD